jgi:hypothetical protein
MKFWGEEMTASWGVAAFEDQKGLGVYRTISKSSNMDSNGEFRLQTRFSKPVQTEVALLIQEPPAYK